MNILNVVVSVEKLCAVCVRTIDTTHRMTPEPEFQLGDDIREGGAGGPCDGTCDGPRGEYIVLGRPELAVI